MDETRILIGSLLLMLVPLPLIVVGVLEGIAVLWWAGIVLIIIGGMTPPITRYAFGDDDEDEGNGEADGTGDAAAADAT